MTAVIHAIIFGINLNISHSMWNSHTIVLSFFATLVTGIPVYIIFWLIMIMKIYSKVYERALFRSALSTTFFLSVVAVYFFSGIEPSLENENFLYITVILSTEASVILHFRAFKNIKSQDHGSAICNNKS